ncbi:MAG TPA: DUF3800 domain-containing protein, partial [Steroidobacteraceae bacterium]|nr:DUF3800 domain-containing protein [Steroidobacteraceae bacterium]
YSRIVTRKRELLARLWAVHGISLDLDSAEIKSNWVRNPTARASRPFLSRLTEPDVTALVDLYFQALFDHNMPIISVVFDKRHFRPPFDAARLHAKAWEMLCERIEMFMWREHPKHRAVMIADDMGKNENVKLAMRHARFLERSTTAGRELRHIVEMPLFVRSELSEGVQLADLCCYATYRAFRDMNKDYEFFQRILPRVYRPDGRLHGLKIHPALSACHELLK